MIGIIPILIVLLVIGSLIYISLKNKSKKINSGRSSTISRKVGGFIGATLLILVFCLTLKDLNNMYTAELKQFKVHAPTLPVEKIKPGEELKDFRLLAHVLAVNKQTGKVIAFFEKVLTPADNIMSLNFDERGLKIEGHVSVESISWHGINGDLDADIESFDHHAGGSYGFYDRGDFTSGKKARSFNDFRTFQKESLFSMQKSESKVIGFYSFMSPLHPDDKLKEITVDEVFSQMKDRRHEDTRQMYYQQSPFQALLVSTGPCGLIIFLGVLLLTQLFKRRTIAFPCLMAAAVIMCIGLKKYEFTIHRGVALNKELNMRQRTVAAKSCKYSIFYQKSGQQVYEKFKEE